MTAPRKHRSGPSIPGCDHEYWIAQCGRWIKLANIRPTWKDVTCKDCLRRRTVPR